MSTPDLNYRVYCRHECLHVAKIKQVNPIKGGDVQIVPEKKDHNSFFVNRAFASVHQPQAGGFYTIDEVGSTGYISADKLKELYTDMSE